MRALIASFLAAPGLAWAHPGHGAQALHSHAELLGIAVVVAIVLAVIIGRRP